MHSIKKKKKKARGMTKVERISAENSVCQGRTIQFTVWKHPTIGHSNCQTCLIISAITQSVSMEKQQPPRFDIQRLTAEPAKAQTHKAQREITDKSLDVVLSNARGNPALGKSPTPGVLRCAFYLPVKFPMKAEQTSEQHMDGNCGHRAFLSP